MREANSVLAVRCEKAEGYFDASITLRYLFFWTGPIGPEVGVLGPENGGEAVELTKKIALLFLFPIKVHARIHFPGPPWALMACVWSVMRSSSLRVLLPTKGFSAGWVDECARAALERWIREVDRSCVLLQAS